MLREVLTSGSAALYPELSPTVAADALDYASTYGIESWDGYLISLARSLGRSIVYSLDEELAKVAEITVVNPFRKENVRKYHSFIEGRLKRAKNC
ncbi:MAG: hypothetical protein HYY68_00340 [Thaumarchaeota archaeon]|nr:hypothetical protein [Nitrososphaerota archaeon]